jgi:sensor c-di-GMP phosphodiesterase-like protein
MYRAKEQGPARYEIFNPSLHERARHRLLTVNQLRHAVDLGQLRLFYQPQVSLLDGEIVGMEALVRWQHPERGLLGPFEFIPLAEESKLIVPIGNWVIEEACRRVARWQADYPDRRLRMCVNVSARQLSYAGLADVISQALSVTGTRSRPGAGLGPQGSRLHLRPGVLLRPSPGPRGHE